MKELTDNRYFEYSLLVDFGPVWSQSWLKVVNPWHIMSFIVILVWVIIVLLASGGRLADR